ncbi:MAG: class I SAM-dependent methyltransferase [Chloroflexi bacterium]|nr:class I SAM-dependent methyltransferase [Chloroflexota bacterium]
MARRVVSRFYELVLGKHPNNTIFSFNYHNVRHLNRYLRQARAKIPGSGLLLVDIGAGKSPYYPIFADITARYVALDVPESLAAGSNVHVERVGALAERVPLAGAVADVVISNQVLEHVIAPEAVAGEIYRILKPGGLFIGSVPHISPVHLEPYDFRRYTDLGVRQLLHNAGFTGIEIEGSGGVYSAAALMIAMDWVLSTRREGQPQRFSNGRAFALFPLVGLLNGTGLLLDSVLPDKQRSPSNLCWTARKPSASL